MNSSVSKQATPNTMEHQQRTLTPDAPGIINVDGDVSLSEEQNRIYWNPHSTGLTNASTWKASFKDEVEVFLKTTSNEAGHVATGAWWTTGFKSNQKTQLYTTEPVRLLASFRANVLSADCESGGEWLRIALACAVQRADGSIIYTEFDFWDSPSVLACPSGNVSLGGNTVYKGGNVVEYKMDQATLGKWNNYSVELTEGIDSAWFVRSGDVLESVYIVVEVIGGTTATVKVDDFWIAKLD